MGSARRMGCLLVAILAVAPTASASGQSCPDPGWPDSTDIPVEPPEPQPYATILSRSDAPAEVDLGIGHLRPSDGYFWGWQHSIRLPLYGEPDGAVEGFLARGWIREQEAEDGWRPLGTDGMLETAYETPSFVVDEARPDGWFRFRFAPADSTRDGTAWVHRCHLTQAGGEIEMVYEPWSERLVSESISPLYFRSEVPHALREGPGTETERIAWITGHHHLEPLEVRGDWMRVRVKQPSDYCAGPEGIDVTVREGWVRWRSDEKGPWVWYPTRGC